MKSQEKSCHEKKYEICSRQDISKKYISTFFTYDNKCKVSQPFHF